MARKGLGKKFTMVVPIYNFSIIINNKVMVVDQWTDINGLWTNLEANLEILGTSDKALYVHSMKVWRPELGSFRQEYSKTCVKQPLKNRQNKDLNDKR